jgi:tetratricopeptide (TPR) repeat protein
MIKNMKSTITLKRILTILNLFAVCYGQSYSGDDMVRQGVHTFYNYETAEAIEILAKARQDHPENPTAHLTWAAARWLHNQANSTVEKTYIDLDNDLNEVIPVYESLVEKNPNDPNYQLYLGSATGLMARIYLGKKEWLETLNWAYSGFRIIQNVEADHPDIVDASLPIGVVDYYAGLSNVLIQWGASLLGLDPSRERGLTKIERAATEGPWSWIEAKGIASFLYLWVDVDLEKALIHSGELVNSFPRNFYFRILYTESLIRCGKMNSALTSLNILKKMVTNLTEIQKHWYFSYLQYELALYHFEEGKTEKALIYINEAVQNYGAELDIILANAWCLKGQLHDLKHERMDAKKAYKSCIKLDNYTYTIDLAKLYLRTPFQN